MAEMIEAAKKINDSLIEIRRDFHMYPEVSGCERETGEKVAKRLTELGYEVRSQVGGHGVIGVLKGSTPGKAVALRADMDALQIQEANATCYKSKTDGVMHACGHDTHMTMLLGAAKLLMDNKEKISGEVRLIFQPAEEMSPVGGSRKMIEEGALEGIDAVFGLHVWPDLPHGKVGVKGGPLMAASDHFTVTINGRSCHAAQPNEGTDAVVMGAQYVQAIQSVISRETNPIDSAVLTIGRFNAGTRYNIVAESCELEGTCRTFNPAVRDHIESQMGKILDGICMMHGATGNINYERGYMAVMNDDKMASEIRASAVKLFGENEVVNLNAPSMCAEDFAFYLNEKPGAFVWLGTGMGEGKTHPLHNSLFDVDEEILWRGAALLASVAMDFLN